MKKITVILTIFLLLVGCNGDEGTSDKPSKVKIGIIRVPNDTAVAIQQKYFDAYFMDKGIETEFIFFDSGVSANQAFASGSIDFAEMGFTNGVVALANELPVKLIWIHEVLGTNESLVVRDKSISSVKELKGKKVATVFSSTSHLSLLKALEMNGMSEKDVTLLNMETASIVSAWDRGDIDAAYTWEPTLSHIKDEGKTLVTSEDLAKDGIMTTNIRLVHEDFADKYPDLVVDFIRAITKAGDLYRSNPNEAIKAAAENIGISFEDAKTQIEGTRWLTPQEEISSDYMGDNGDFLKMFLSTSEYWYAQGFTSRVPSEQEIRDFIDISYIEKSLEK